MESVDVRFLSGRRSERSRVSVRRRYGYGGVKKGEYRKSEYEAYYDGAKKAFIVTLYAAEGDFKGSKSFDNREIKIKYHLLSDAKDVKSVVVNGKETAFSVEKKDDAAFPFNVGDSACDGDCLSVKLNIDVKRQYEICFYLS